MELVHQVDNVIPVMQDVWIAQEHLQAAQPVLGDITYSTTHVFQYAQTNTTLIQTLQIKHAYLV